MSKPSGAVIMALAVAALACGVSSNDRNQPLLSRRTYPHRGGPAASPRAEGAPSEAAEAAMAPCADIKPLQLYRFIDGVDDCMEPLEAADIARLEDPFAVNVLRKGIGNAAAWPKTVEEIVALVRADPSFQANQKNYMLGEGSQIPTTVAPRDAGRNYRYVITWGVNASPSIFLSAAPSGTHPGRPPSFLQVLGFDRAKNLFNYYEYISNPGQPTRSWSFGGDSTNARNPQTTGRGCFMCHINGALNMKELTSPWNNWNSPKVKILAANVPAGVVTDPLFDNGAALAGADQLQTNFQGLQASYTQLLVARSISGGTVTGVPALLRRLVTTTTINLASSKPVNDPPTGVLFPPDFFVARTILTSGQINLSFTTPSLLIDPKAQDAFVSDHDFALRQLRADGSVVYEQPGTTFFPLLVPVPAFEDFVAIQQLINQKVIDANFAASILLVDFPNPVFSPQRASLMQYADRITTARVLSAAGPNPNGVPAQFIALVTAAAATQPACDPAKLAQCTPEQQFLFFAGQSDWKTRAASQLNAYFAGVGSRLATQAGLDEYLTLAVSRQTQFSTVPGICNLNEFSLLFPHTDLTFTRCKRMNADGTTSDDASSDCSQPCS